MALLDKMRRLVTDPPPAYAFEVSHAGIAWAHVGKDTRFGFAPLEEDVLDITPLKDNVARPDMLFAGVRALAAGNGKSRKRTAALILPDYSTRVAVLDFDSFPSDRNEQESLVRFRVKRSIPFELDSARVSFSVQSAASAAAKRYDVLVAVTALEIVARYEAAFRSAGFEPGYVTTSTLVALDLVPGDGPRVMAKLSGDVLTVVVIEDGRIKLMRCVQLARLDEQEVMAVLYPTFAYVEDKMPTVPTEVWTCGFGAMAQSVSDRCAEELGVEAKPVRSRLGAPDQTNAGLLGYLGTVGA